MLSEHLQRLEASAPTAAVVPAVSAVPAAAWGTAGAAGSQQGLGGGQPELLWHQLLSESLGLAPTFLPSLSALGTTAQLLPSDQQCSFIAAAAQLTSSADMVSAKSDSSSSTQAGSSSSTGGVASASSSGAAATPADGPAQEGTGAAAAAPQPSQLPTASDSTASTCSSSNCQSASSAADKGHRSITSFWLGSSRSGRTRLALVVLFLLYAFTVCVYSVSAMLPTYNWENPAALLNQQQQAGSSAVPPVLSQQVAQRLAEELDSLGLSSFRSCRPTAC